MLIAALPLPPSPCLANLAINLLTQSVAEQLLVTVAYLLLYYLYTSIENGTLSNCRSLELYKPEPSNLACAFF